MQSASEIYWPLAKKGQLENLYVPDIHYHFSSNHYHTYVWVNHFLLDLGIREIQNFDRLVLKRLLHQWKFHNPLYPLYKDKLFHEKWNSLLRIRLLEIGSNPHQFQKGSKVQHNREALSLIPRFWCFHFPKHSRWHNFVHLATLCLNIHLAKF